MHNYYVYNIHLICKISYKCILFTNLIIIQCVIGGNYLINNYCHLLLSNISLSCMNVSWNFFMLSCYYIILSRYASIRSLLLWSNDIISSIGIDEICKGATWSLEIKLVGFGILIFICCSVWLSICWWNRFYYYIYNWYSDWLKNWCG